MSAIQAVIDAGMEEHLKTTPPEAEKVLLKYRQHIAKSGDSLCKFPVDYIAEEKQRMIQAWFRRQGFICTFSEDRYRSFDDWECDHYAQILPVQS